MRSFVHSTLFLALVWALFFIAPPSTASTSAVGDVASTDDQTPVLVDLTANDSDSEGRPLVVTLNGNGCPGDAELLFDGTLLFTPTSTVTEAQTCSIGYQVNGQVASLSLTIFPEGDDGGGGGGGGGNPGVCGGNWGSGVLQPDASGFKYQNQPIFLAGYYPGLHSLVRSAHLSEPPTNSTYYQQLIDALADRNINLVRAFLTNFSATGNHGRHIVPYAQHPTSCCTAAPPAGSGVNWGGVNKYNLDQWNDDFFDHWANVISYAQSRGVMMQLAFFETRLTWNWDNVVTVENGQPLIAAGRKYSLLASQNNVNGVAINNTSSPQQWFSDPVALQRQTDFVKEAVKRLGGYDNVLWELSNEPPIASYLSPAVLADWQDDICAAMRQGEVDGGHLRHAVMPVDLPEHRDVPGHGTPGNDENFTGVHASLVADYGDGSGPPLVADNDCCFNAGTRAAQRKKSWTSVVSGAHPLLFNYKADEFYYPLVGDSSTLNTIEWVGHPRRLVLERNLDFASMVPRDDLVSGSGGDVWMRADQGNQYLAYYLTSGNATFSSLPSDYSAEWFDPRSARYLNAVPSAVNGNSATFSTPACGDFTPPSPECDGNSDWVLLIQQQTTGPVTQRAFGGTPWVVGPAGAPIEAEHYDEMVDSQGNVIPGAGQGEAYSDSTPGNANGGFRPDEDVDVLVAGNTHVNHTTNGEWLEYTVNVQQSGLYAMHVNYASRTDAAGGELRLEVYDGNTLELSRTITLADTNDADPSLDFTYFTDCEPFNLGAGNKVVRLVMSQASFNLNFFHLVPAAATQTPWNNTPHAVPGLIEAEHFDGGATAGYCDSTPWNIGVDFRQDEWVDLALGNGSHVIAWAPAGEWLEYTLNVQGGTHEVEVTYATLNSGLPGRARLDVMNGNTVEDTLTFDLPANGAPGPYEDLLVGDLNLTTGSRVLRFTYLEGNFAFAKVRIGDDTPPEPPVPGDDTFFVPRGSAFTIPAADLLDNDEPLGQVEIDPTQPIISQPQKGSVTWDAASSSFIYQSTADTHTPQTLQYGVRLTSHPQMTAVGTATLRPISEAPVANPDQFVMPPNTTLTIYGPNLRANDTGAYIFIGGVETFIPGLSGGLEALQYTPPFNQGTAQFRYWVEDINGTPSNLATVTITVSPSAGLPVANDDSFMMAQQDLTGNPAKLQILWADAFANDVAVQGGVLRMADNTQPVHGTMPGGHIGGWNYYPANSNWQGTDTFTYLLEESGLSAANWATISIEVVPAPVGGNDSFQTGHNTPLVLQHALDLLPNDNGFQADIAIVDGSWTVPQNGTLDTTVSGQVTYTPAPGWSGTDSFAYVLANSLDGENSTWRTRSAPVTVTVTVDPPDATATDDDVLVRGDVSQVVIPLADLFANDAPAAELTLVGTTAPALGTLVQVGEELRYTPSADFARFGEDSFTYTVRRFGGNANVQPTATVVLHSDGSYTDSLSEDFEGPDLSAWDSVVTTNGHAVRVSTSAASNGLQGLEVELSGSAGGSALLEHRGISEASHVAMSFTFDPSQLTLAVGDLHPIAGTRFGSLALGKLGNQFQLSGWMNTDAGGAVTTGWTLLEGGPQRVRVEWSAASGAGAADGSVSLWIDDVLQGQKLGVDNASYRTEWARIGALWGIDTGTVGTMAFDAVRIEVGPEDRPILVEDAFESGNFSAWTGTPQVGGTVSLVPDGGQNRLAVSTAGAGSAAYLYKQMDQTETHGAMRFTLDPGNLITSGAHSFYLAGGIKTGQYWTFHLRLRNPAGQPEVALVSINDAGGAVSSTYYPVSTSSSELEVEWWAASGPGQDDGGLRLSIDGQVTAEFLGVDNDERSFDRLVVGAAASVDAGTSGTFYVDDVEAWRGLQSREHFAVDDFTGGLASEWTPIQAGGTVTAATAAAHGGSEAATVSVLPNATAVYLLDGAPDQDRSYTASFDLHLGDLTMAENDSVILLGANRTGYWVGAIWLHYSGGQFKVRGTASTDTAWTTTGLHNLGDPTQVHQLTLQWWAASAPGANDGGVRLHLNGTLLGESLGIDNDTHYVDQTGVGAVAGLKPSTSGTFTIDNFESWR